MTLLPLPRGSSIWLLAQFQHSHPVASDTLANVGIIGPVANIRFQWSFGFDIRFFQLAATWATNVKSTPLVDRTTPDLLEKTPVTNSASAPLPASLLEALARYDTPTICNAMEVIAPERRLIGYTTKPLVCPFPDLAPMVGYARTVTIRSVLKSSLPPDEQARRRIAYYEYMGTGFGPRITVIQDIDGPDVGYGAFWGEVQSNVHKALGCLGVITDGSIRDIPQWAPGFQALAGSIGPSHAWVHAENFGGEVRVAGMTVRSDDLLHADQHGAIVIPADIAAKIPEAAELCGRRETPILEIARAKDFSLEKLKEALKRSAEIH